MAKSFYLDFFPGRVVEVDILEGNVPGPPGEGLLALSGRGVDLNMGTNVITVTM